MNGIVNRLNAYIQSHPFDSGDSGCETVLEQLYQAYIQSHEGDPEEIREGFQELEEFLCSLPLEDNDAVFTLCCNLCSIYQRMAFMDGLQYGATNAGDNIIHFDYFILLTAVRWDREVLLGDG